MCSKLFLACALALMAPAASFGVVLVNDSFDYGLPDGTVINNGTVPAWGNGFSTPGTQFSTVDFDGVGGSVFMSSTNDGPYLRQTNSNAAGEPAYVEFILSMAPNSNPNGARVMFESTASGTSTGFGVNFDVKLDINDGQRYFDLYPRVGATHGPAEGAWLTLIKAPTIRVFGTYSRDGLGAGTISINYDDGSAILSASRTAAHGVLGSDIAFRTGSGRQYFVDGVKAQTRTIPEPATLGLLVGGLIAGLRRSRH